ncbi:MAG TPA: stage II sporulation protein M [Candidatus Binatia bacterium]
MIIDLQRFIADGRNHWSQLESLLNRLENDAEYRLDLETSRRFYYLYQQAAADLARIVSFTSEGEIRHYLESLLSRAYGEIHETREKPHRLKPLRWFFNVFPQTFRRHWRAFWLSLAVSVAGAAFGALALGFDPGAKEVLMPFSHLQGSPSQRVAYEERAKDDRLEGERATFSTNLISHNTRVSIFALALGMSWGVGTVILLFYNGVILGAVAFDYIVAGETEFLLGWLLPHGVIEIPAILVAGQAGLVLGHALVGRDSQLTLRARLREVGGDLVTLIFGAGILLGWAGLIEAFLSQYHEPVLPYSFKICFGVLELILLSGFLAWSGSSGEPKAVSTHDP